MSTRRTTKPASHTEAREGPCPLVLEEPGTITGYQAASRLMIALLK